ncbi:MEDS domain-containing protein [Halovenus aranensis]|uniref:MEDS domain-containing protein n=1 Tax=Halovenus aranensis TaxID=890420 RepID=UPI0015A08440|nr:MEDS domain-containing protein [Halovenus aranensis]
MGDSTPGAGTDESEDETNRLLAEFSREDLARHLALFYREPATQLSAASTFIRYGLHLGRRCFYLTDANTRDAIKAALRDAGVDVTQRMAAGDLTIRDASEVYLDSGFNPEEMIATLESAVEESIEMGYEGFWVAGENTWCFHTEASFDHILDFEAEFDATCPDYPVTALCQYDIDRFGEESTAKALWTHEQIIYRSTICENPYYLTPDAYQSEADSQLNAKLMLEQTHDLARSRRQVTQREQRLDVVSRILRHNIRNDLNVVRTNLELIEEENSLTETDSKRLETAIEHVNDVFEIADKARAVQQTLDHLRVETLALDETLARAVDRAEAAVPGATISIDGESETTVVADSNLDDAVVELLTAILDNQEEQPSVSLTCSTPAEGTLRLDIQAPDALFPASDRAALERGSETQLEHGRGLGLWLANWIIENGHGTLAFPAEGPQLRIELNRVAN